METPGAVQLLTVWERGLSRDAPGRAALLLHVARPDAYDAQLAALSVGAADRQLLRLRERLFGRKFEAVCRCPRCREAIELAFAGDDLPAAGTVGDATGEPTDDRVRRLVREGGVIEYRLPTWADLAAVARLGDPAAARTELVRRCVGGASTGAEPEAGGMPDETLVAAVAGALETEDPLAGTRLALTCPGCGHAWSEVFDVAAFLWSELDQWARQTLREVHQLARAYGWTESESLALSPRRRRLYLEMIAA